MAVSEHRDDRLLLQVLVVDGRSNNEDVVDEQGTPIFLIDVICLCWQAVDVDVDVDVDVAVLPKAVTGAIATTINASKIICGIIHGVDLVILLLISVLMPDTPYLSSILV